MARVRSLELSAGGLPFTGIRSNISKYGYHGSLVERRVAWRESKLVTTSTAWYCYMVRIYFLMRDYVVYNVYGKPQAGTARRRIPTII